MVICANQVTVAVALSLFQKDNAAVETIVIYDTRRCDVSVLRAAGATCLPYSRYFLLRHFISNIWLRKIELCVPHFRLGRFLLVFAKLVQQISLIDDGLDTLRDQPRNVDLHRFEPGVPFYTFKYPVTLGKWLDKFNVVAVADISDIAHVDRPLMRLDGISRVIIESPPLQRALSHFELHRSDTLVVKHSNAKKNTLALFGASSVSGSAIALEQSLTAYPGELVVGESMAAVYALLRCQNLARITVYVSIENRANLTPFVRLVKDNPRAILKLV